MDVDHNIPPGWLAWVGGECLPVTHFFWNGEDAASPFQANAFVAGPSANGTWWSGDTADVAFERAN